MLPNFACTIELLQSVNPCTEQYSSVTLTVKSPERCSHDVSLSSYEEQNDVKLSWPIQYGWKEVALSPYPNAGVGRKDGAFGLTIASCCGLAAHRCPYWPTSAYMKLFREVYQGYVQPMGVVRQFLCVGFVVTIMVPNN